MSDSREDFANNIDKLINEFGVEGLSSEEAARKWEQLMTSQGKVTVNTSMVGKIDSIVLKREQLGTLEKEGRQK